MDELLFRPWPAHMSYSQVSSLTDCGERYWLERGFGLHGQPQWSLVGGQAFHLATQFLDAALEQKKFSSFLLHLTPAGVASPARGRHQNLDLDVDVESEKYRYKAHLKAMQDARWASLHRLGAEIADLPGSVRADDEQDLPGSIRAGSEDHPGSIRAEDQPGSVLAGDEDPAPGQYGAPEDLLRELWLTALDFQIGEQYQNLANDQPGDKPFSVPDCAHWRAAGRATIQWPGKEDHAWWLAEGFSMLERYALWRRTSGWTVAWLGALPAIELEVSATIAGDIPVVGFMDRGMMNPALGGAPTIVDLKTNKNIPASGEQLGLYATLLEARGLPRAPYGAFYMARKGIMTDPYDLSIYPRQYFEWKYRSVKAVRDAGQMLANPNSTFCGICGVRSYCYAVGGSQADQIPRPWMRRAMAPTPSA